MKYINNIKLTMESPRSKKEVDMLDSQNIKTIPINTQPSSHE